VHNCDASTCDLTVRIEGPETNCDASPPHTAATRVPMPKLQYASLGRLGEHEHGKTVNVRRRNARRSSSHPVRLHH
jgi:hypothetical protein